MSKQFINGLPAERSPLNSSEIRDNFEALHLRTGKVEAHATVPASTSITTDDGVIYFNGRIPVNVASNKIDLGDSDVGVLPFVNIGYFKDILIAAKVSFNQTTNKYEATTYFIEGPEKSSSVSSDALIPLRATDIPIARFVVRHNGINLTGKGQIEAIQQSQLIDVRNYLDVGGIEYFSATVGDRLVQTDAYGVLVTDGYGSPVIEGETVGSFVGYAKDAYGNNIHPIQQAIDSLPSGGTILLKRGTYYIDSTITIPANIRLLGEGKSTKVQMLDVFQGPAFTITGNNTSIENMHLLGTLPTANYVNNAMVLFVGVEQCSIKDCFIDYCLTGVEFSSSNRNTCTSNFFSDNNVAVLFAGSTDKNLVALNQFSNNLSDISNVGTNTTVGNVT